MKKMASGILGGAVVAFVCGSGICGAEEKDDWDGLEVALARLILGTDLAADAVLNREEIVEADDEIVVRRYICGVSCKRLLTEEGKFGYGGCVRECLALCNVQEGFVCCGGRFSSV